MDGTSPSYIEPFPLAGSVIRLTFDRSIDVPDSCSRTEPNPDFGPKIRVFIWDPVFVKGAFVTLGVGSVLAPSDLLCNFSFRFTGGGRVVEVVVFLCQIFGMEMVLVSKMTNMRFIASILLNI